MEILDNPWVKVSITRGPIRGKDRNRIGLLMRVIARPEVEDFMASLGNNRKSPVDAYSDAWQNCNPEGPTLEVYESDHKFDRHRGYTLEAVGLPPIIDSSNDGRPTTSRMLATQDESFNLSFLRVVGIGSDEGVTVGFLGPYSNDYIRRLRMGLAPALRTFLSDYIAPITINLQIVNGKS